jgi:hypothetical protein
MKKAHKWELHLHTANEDKLRFKRINDKIIVNWLMVAKPRVDTSSGYPSRSGFCINNTTDNKVL